MVVRDCAAWKLVQISAALATTNVDSQGSAPSCLRLPERKGRVVLLSFAIKSFLGVPSVAFAKVSGLLMFFEVFTIFQGFQLFNRDPLVFFSLITQTLHLQLATSGAVMALPVTPR